jgi:hypothetical protein
LSELRQIDFFDPAIVVEHRQRQCCHGCRFNDQDRTPGFEKFVCRKGMRKAVTDLYDSVRCVKYSEKEAANKAAKKSKRPYSTRKDY